MCVIFFQRDNTHFFILEVLNMLYLLGTLCMMIAYTLYIEFKYNYFFKKSTMYCSEHQLWIERINLSSFYIDRSGLASTHYFCLTNDAIPVCRWIFDNESNKVVFYKIYDNKLFKQFKREQNTLLSK